MDIDANRILVFGILALITLCAIGYFAKHNKVERKEETDEMEEMFFDKISKSSKAYKLMRIYFPFDLMMIKSLLASERIPHYAEFEHLMGLLPFVQAPHYNNTDLYILEEDYPDAIAVLRNYLAAKTFDNYKAKERIRNLVELFFIEWVAYSPQNNLGMDVNYEKRQTPQNHL